MLLDASKNPLKGFKLVFIRFNLYLFANSFTSFFDKTNLLKLFFFHILTGSMSSILPFHKNCENDKENKPEVN